LAKVLNAAGRTQEAIDELRAALRHNADWPAALGELSAIFATAPDPQFRQPSQAIQLADRACQLTQREDAELLLVLSAAFASANQFDNAIATARIAHQKALAAGQTDLAATIASRLDLYRSSPSP
jgi:tetratricopeptide (TPR) repeat protein